MKKLKPKLKHSFPDGKLDDALMDNIEEVGTIIEISKKIDEARGSFPIDIFRINAFTKEQAELRNELIDWFDKWFGFFETKKIKCSYDKYLNPSRRDNNGIL